MYFLWFLYTHSISSRNVIYSFGPTTRIVAGGGHSNIAATLQQRCSATFQSCTATILQLCCNESVLYGTRLFFNTLFVSVMFLFSLSHQNSEQQFKIQWNSLPNLKLICQTVFVQKINKDKLEKEKPCVSKIIRFICFCGFH